MLLVIQKVPAVNNNTGIHELAPMLTSEVDWEGFPAAMTSVTAIPFAQVVRLGWDAD